ncbi:MAG: hypothetical protein ACJ74U_16725 [Jatrophihabitantaceae bacterium]
MPQTGYTEKQKQEALAVPPPKPTRLRPTDAPTPVGNLCLMDEQWVPFESLVATSHRVEKYGGWALADSALIQIVDALNSGKLPMNGNHDLTKPIRTRDLEAKLVTLDDGERAVRLTGMVVQADWEAVGPVGGMSFSTRESIGRAIGLNPDGDELTLLADAGWFDDQSIGDASVIISALAPVAGARLYQFSAVDDARVILEMGFSFVASCGPGLATSAVWDGIKYLLAHRKMSDDGVITSTRIELVTDLNAGTVTGIIDTSNPDAVSQALATYSEAVAATVGSIALGKQVIVWKEPDQRWVPPS